MIRIADENPAVDSLLLEMTLETKRRVSGSQHARVDRAMRRMTGHAAFADRVMLEHKGPALGGMTLRTGLVRREKGKAATLDFLVETRVTAFYRISLVRIVAIDAVHLVFQHWVMVR